MASVKSGFLAPPGGCDGSETSAEYRRVAFKS